MRLLRPNKSQDDWSILRYDSLECRRLLVNPLAWGSSRNRLINIIVTRFMKMISLLKLGNI